ncbi:hypothetical protein Vi05172_g1760 [Venturia inaequalis]|uniref:Uncharacterized protein n=1 Tax=Venturia inaequalis TaxID=5025 RepID=A0A8H3V8J8_VENIN|nr:hypothetical protein EG327_005882 [Venturia inaequalis]RDI88253.1 hypothetical protein Vi05172_g1760 [Venturia inaequalis]
MPWPNLSNHLQTQLTTLHIPTPLTLHLRKTLESIHMLLSKISIDTKSRALHRPSREKALVEAFDSLLRKSAVLLRAVNEMPGDVDRRGILKEAGLRAFGEACEDVIDLVENVEGVRGMWLGVLRRGQGVEYREVKVAEEEEDGGAVGNGETGDRDTVRIVRDSIRMVRESMKTVGSEEKSSRKEDLWAAQRRYEDEIVRLVEEAKAVIWRLLTGEETARVVEGKVNGEAEEEMAGSKSKVEEAGAEDSGFFEYIDKFLEENKGEMDPKLKRYSKY